MVTSGQAERGLARALAKVAESLEPRAAPLTGVSLLLPALLWPLDPPAQLPNSDSDVLREQRHALECKYLEPSDHSRAHSHANMREFGNSLKGEIAHSRNLLQTWALGTGPGSLGSFLSRLVP